MSYYEEQYYEKPRRRGNWFFTFLLMLLSAILGGIIAINVAISMDLLVKESDVVSDNPLIGQEGNGTANLPYYIPQPNLDTSTTVTAVAAKLSPSVVSISNYGAYLDFFHGSQEVQQSSGSGVIIAEDGLIITNNHVVSGASRITVSLADGSQYEAELLGKDSRTDLALLKIEANHLPAATFGDSDTLQVGEIAIAIGNPGGEDFARSVTQGVISGLNRLLVNSEGLPFRLIQTDAAINPGNSGGALANAKGEVIGINTIKISSSGYEGMGFAIPANVVKEIAQTLQENGKVIRPALGVSMRGNVDAQIASYNRLSLDYGVIVLPQTGGPAAKAGMKNNDIIIAVDGEKIATSYELQEKIFSYQVGDTVTVQVLRDNQKIDLQITLAELAE